MDELPRRHALDLPKLVRGNAEASEFAQHSVRPIALICARPSLILDHVDERQHDGLRPHIIPDLGKMLQPQATNVAIVHTVVGGGHLSGDALARLYSCLAPRQAAL